MTPAVRGQNSRRGTTTRARIGERRDPAVEARVDHPRAERVRERRDAERRDRDGAGRKRVAEQRLVRERTRDQPQRPERVRTDRAAAPSRATTAASTRTESGKRARSSTPVRVRADLVARGRRIVPKSPAGAKAAPFVVLVMTLLGAGLIATLWLSTAAAADSYQLEGLRNDISSLTDQNARLRRDVESREAAPRLAKSARDLGLVPVGEAARLVINPDGTHRLVGKPVPVPAPSASPVVPPPAAAERESVQPEAQAGLAPVENGDGRAGHRG